MSWHLKHAANEDMVLAQCEQMKREPPSWIKNKPQLRDDLMFTWQAFFELSWDRQIGMGSWGPISYGSISSYADHFGLTDEERGDFVMNLRAMDAAWLKHQASQKPKT